jgi:CubicO group peptidase (beta-lactamase class C family)
MRRVLIIMVALSAASGTSAQDHTVSDREPHAKPVVEVAPPQTAAQVRPLSDLEAFVDGIVPLQISRDDIAGAVVAIVEDGKVVVEKGYGYADMETRKPVSASDTLFRPGSISKLFTWTAVMQLVEQGKLNLDQDVNSYLDFTIPATFAQPITLRNIMTHSSGFEETAKDLFVDRAQHLEPLGSYLATHLPRRLFPPATTPAYSNYATALAGYIVQRVSGEDFNQYVTEHIFKPLGMAHSTFHQPLPRELEPLMSKGYKIASGPAKTFEIVQAWPAGSVSTSAEDMTHFMIAHLQDGEYRGAQILRPETARLMHSRQFGVLPEMNGMALGFYEETRNGRRIIGHGGDTQYFHSDLHLVPEIGLGFFVSYNSAGRAQANNRQELWRALLDRYWPYQPATVKTASTGKDAKSVSGNYLISRRSDDSVLRVLGLLSETSVAALPDGNLIVSSMKAPNGQPKKWHEVDALTYQELHGPDRIAFRRAEGKHLDLITDLPVFLFQRVSWYRSLTFFRLLLGFAVTMFVLTVIAWPVAAGIRRHYETELSLSTPDLRLRKAVRLVCILDLIVIGLWVYALSAGLSQISLLSRSFDMRLRVLEIVGLAAATATLIVLFNAYRAWRDPTRWRWAKLWETALALACLGFAWLIIALNLAGFSTRY